MKLFIFFALLFPIGANAVAPFLTSQSGEYCYYDDGQVIKNPGITCPLRLHINKPESKLRFSDEYYRQREESARQRMEFGKKRALGMQQSTEGLIPKMLENITRSSNKNRMETVLQEYPNAFETLREPEFVSWMATDDELVKLFIKAKNNTNPDPIALETLLIGYKLFMMPKHPRFSDWRVTLDEKQQKSIKNSLTQLGKGNFKGIKKWLSHWDTFKNSN